MSGNILAQKSFTVRRAAKESYTFLRYSDDGGKTFTASAFVENDEWDGRNISPVYEVRRAKGAVYADDSAKHVIGKKLSVSLRCDTLIDGVPPDLQFVVLIRQNGDIKYSEPEQLKTLKYDGNGGYHYDDYQVQNGVELFSIQVHSVYNRSHQDAMREIHFYDIKVEVGNHHTPFSPRPEDAALGLTPGAWLGTAVWGKPYPPLTTDAYTWTKVKGEDGTDGKDAANVYLSTQMLLVNTNDSGVVEKKDLNGIEAQVLAYRGDERIEATIVSCQCSPEVGAKVQGDTIKLTAVRTDRKTKMAYGSGYIDIVAEVDGKTYPLRLFVGVNIAKFTASVVSDVRSFRQEFGKYKLTTDGNIEQAYSLIEQTARDITMEVSARSHGVNLLQGTDFLGDLTTYQPPGDGTVEITFGDDPKIAHIGHRYMHVEAKGLSTSRCAGKHWTAKVEAGKKYTASMWMMTPDKTTIDFEIYLECIAVKGGASPVWLNRHVTPMERNNTWYVHTDTFGIPDGYDTLQVNAMVARNGNVYFSEVQLEEGDTRSAWSPYVGDREASMEKSGIKLMPGCFQVDAKKMIVNGDLQAKSVLAESSTQYSLMRDGQFELGRIGSDTEHHKNIDFAFDGNGNPVLRFYRPDGSLMGVIDEPFFASSAAGDTWQETAPMARLGDIRYSPTKHDVVNYNGSFRTFQKFQCGFTLYGDTKRYNHTGEGFPPYYDGYTYTDRKSTIATDAEMQTGFIPNGVYLIKPDKNWRFYKKEATGNLYIRLYRCEVYAAGRLSNHFLIEEVADESQVIRNIEG